MFASWTSPDNNSEFAVSFDRERDFRVLVVPALFDESNKLRRLTVEVMRRLDGAGIDSILPDLPGCHESLAPLSEQTLESWREATRVATEQFEATHLFCLRGGAILAPNDMPGWRYAPITGAKVLRALLRARIIAARESGADEKTDELLDLGRKAGLRLAGYDLGPEMISQLEAHKDSTAIRQMEVLQSDIGGAGLWLKAEPSEDAKQADALAAVIATGLPK